jgi:nitroreductase
MENETLKLIRQRRSIRSYKPDPIKDEDLQAVIEAGQYAPNAGDQAWHFTVVQNRDLLKKLNLAAKEAAKNAPVDFLRKLGNDEHFDCLYGAPALVIVSGSEKAPVPMDVDCAAATENLLIAAESLGLGSCWIYFVLMAFQSPQGEALRKELKMPDAYKPYCAAVLGYKAESTPTPPARKPGLATYIK